MNFSFRTLLPFLFVLTLLVGVTIGLKLSSSEVGKPALFTAAEPDRLDEILCYINYNYVDTINTDALMRSLVADYLKKDEVIGDVFAHLDPHSTYIPASSMKAETENLQGNFEGIGIEFNIVRDTILVVSPISGGPSESMGIRSGDRIVEVGDSVVAGVGITEESVRGLLRGPKGSTVKVSVSRLGEPELLSFNIVRDQIPLYSLDVAYMVDDQVGYIKLNRFSATTVEEFTTALTKLKGQGMKSLLLDLRGNPGGYLIAATRVVDELLGGKKMIVYTQGKTARREEYLSGNEGRFEQGDLVVLIDEGSASASEIVAGALQDQGRAAIAGRRSFGKGLVQEIFGLDDSSAIRLTVARYYTPSGRCIQRPYYNGVEAYYEEYMERLEANGDEPASAEEAAKQDFGIMPDLLIHSDTSADRRAFYRLYNSGQIQRFAYDLYGREQQKIMAYASVKDYRSSYQISEDQWKRFIAKVQASNLLPDVEQRDRIRPWVETALKAQVARQAWKNDGFYPVFQDLDLDFQQAYSLLQDGKSRALIKTRVAVK